MRAAAILSLSAVELREQLASGAVTALEAAEAYLSQIAKREGEVRAFAWHDAMFVRHQADTMDRHRRSGRPIGPLHGLPVGVKDIIDTKGIPTENGTAQDKGRVPTEDAVVIERLKAAGAIIMGKTVTTELAFMDPSQTRNPHNSAHTPGGSSAGSAAAVASAMVPLAIGTQTGGSVIRPAAYCGVVGYKPTFGLLPRTGVLAQAPSLDTLGVFARTPDDAALLADALAGHDPSDDASLTGPSPAILATARTEPPVPPTLAFVRLPAWDDADEETRSAFDQLAVHLGERVFEAELPTPFVEANLQRWRINVSEMAHLFRRYERQPNALGPAVRAALEEGSEVKAIDYLAARDWQRVLSKSIVPIFDRADAILCASAPSAAPRDRGTTGPPIFNGLWTLCGTPAVTLPLLTSTSGMPMGVQLVGARRQDGRLLRTARWLYNLVEGTT